MISIRFGMFWSGQCPFLVSTAFVPARDPNETFSRLAVGVLSSIPNHEVQLCSWLKRIALR